MAQVPIQTLLQQAMTLHQQGNVARAQVLYEDVLRKQPRNADANHLMGLIALDSKAYDTANAFISKAIKANPGNPIYYVNQGIVLKALGQIELAVASYNRAIALQPNYAAAYYSRGNALRDLKRLDEALLSFDKAIALQPREVLYHSNKGLVLQALNRLEEAIACFDTAIELDPNYAEGYFNRSLALLLAGNFSEGWKYYEWRWKCKEFLLTNRYFEQPRWNGTQTLDGKTILLYSEQGLGDSLQFCRYAKMVAELGARVILQVQRSLITVLQGLAGVHEVLAAEDPLPPFDYQCPLLSLPAIFQTNTDNVVDSMGYLKLNGADLGKWSGRLGEKKMLRVGIVWSGNATHGNDSNRSMGLAHMVEKLPGQIELFSLQKELRLADQATLEAQPQVRHFGDELKDFSDTAALCSLMDVVISVDTSVAHLSAALGLRTWILLPFSPDWRWMLDRSDCPWYSSVTLYRQRAIADWTHPFDGLRSDLDELSKALGYS